MAVTMPATCGLSEACWLARRLPRASTVGCQDDCCATIVDTVCGGFDMPLIALAIMVFLKCWNHTSPPINTAAMMSMMIMRLVVALVICELRCQACCCDQEMGCV